MENESRFGSPENVSELERRNQELEIRVRELEQKNAELERLAYFDQNTGLLNRNGLEKELREKRLLPEEEHDPERREKKSPTASVMILDIDRFKSWNDTFGHLTADQVLRAVGEKLKESTRKSDIVARWGGEELVVVFQGTDSKGIMEKFHIRTDEDIKEGSPGRARFNVDVIIEGVEFTVTLSGGVTDYDPANETFDNALERADKGLYKAKGKDDPDGKGRDRIIRADE